MSEVLEIIERARREQRKELNLSYIYPKKLQRIPDEVFSLQHLETLNISNNEIKEVPERIRDLVNLKHLDVSENPIERLTNIPGLTLSWDIYLRFRHALSRDNVEGMTFVDISEGESMRADRANEVKLSDELALLTCLRNLKISFYLSKESKSPGEIRDLIENIGHFHLLERLSLWGVLRGEVPIGIRNMKGLQVLNLGNAGLIELPDWIGELKRLRSLGLIANELTDLPDSLGHLSELETIGLNYNRFTEIPNVLFRIKNLTTLGLGCDMYRDYRGHIRQVPADILQLTKLDWLDVEGHPIEVPPLEVVKQGIEAIKNYWRQQQEVGIDYLCEAKLIIVGEAGAGKTSLARKIEDSNYELKPQELSTEGIDVIRWSFPAAVRVKREGREELHSTNFKVNIWDFGGQEIYHATHQFFLTRRSLYALVTDDRKEDTDFNYWLQVIELLSDRSPLLIVQNEKQERQRVIDLGSLRADFPNLREAFRTNLATNSGLEELERAIRHELERLPHIGTPLPKTWSQVRTALENDARNYITLEEYLGICQENGFTRREDKLQLSGYLHDLGICLHFQDDPVLRNTVILKPNWGTDAVYRVLDDKTVLNNRGRFGPSDLARIWSDEKYSDMRDELLRLMMRFQLCYQLPNKDVYIAPHLLSPARPADARESSGGLVVRYDYEFMPKGIITRFIVAVNHLIADQSLVWKSGVILAREGARAEVIEDYQRRKITVRVNGADSRGLLAIIDDQLERIHSSFARLKYEKYLPCNCNVCQTRDDPFAYPLSELKDFAAKEKGRQCGISGDLVDAAQLIRDVLPGEYAILQFMNQLEHLDQKPIHSPEPPPVKEVFVSYAWGEESMAVVDKLQEALTDRDIRFVRDKNDVKYKDSIREFMKRIGRGKCIVVVLSKKYLESKNCMYELTEIADRGEIRDRVFPIVLGDAMIYEAIGRLRYIKYWEQKKDELDAEMKGVGGEYLQGIREELDLFAKIRITIGEIVNTLGDMNALSLDQHQGSNFDSLIQALEARLAN
ncbi:MAG TPA: COR domain-containing protein [Blastocatellia bacterium]|nr:COR domain-containing protein [Blastocatellia bacterium]